MQNTNFDTLPPKMQEQIENTAFELDLARAIQNQHGGPEAVPDEQAKAEGRITRLLRDTFRNLQTVQSAEGMDELVDDDYIDSFIEGLPPEAESRARRYIDAGKSVNEILSMVENTIREYGIADYQSTQRKPGEIDPSAGLQ